MDEILEAIEQMKKDMVFYGTLDTLENAIKGGRVNPIAGKLINALNFKVIIKIDEGLQMKKDMVFYGTLDTLENAIKGGRVNPIAGKLINALNFKVIIKIDEGLVKPIDKARGESNSLKKLFTYIKNCVDINEIEHKDVIVGHANCPEKAENVKKFIVDHYNFEETLVANIGPIMGTFTAEGAILIAVL